MVRVVRRVVLGQVAEVEQVVCDFAVQLLGLAVCSQELASLLVVEIAEVDHVGQVVEVGHFLAVLV